MWLGMLELPSKDIVCPEYGCRWPKIPLRHCCNRSDYHLITNWHFNNEPFLKRKNSQQHNGGKTPYRPQGARILDIVAYRYCHVDSRKFDERVYQRAETVRIPQLFRSNSEHFKSHELTRCHNDYPPIGIL